MVSSCCLCMLSEHCSPVLNFPGAQRYSEILADLGLFALQCKADPSGLSQFTLSSSSSLLLLLATGSCSLCPCTNNDTSESSSCNSKHYRALWYGSSLWRCGVGIPGLNLPRKAEMKPKRLDRKKQRSTHKGSNHSCGKINALEMDSAITDLHKCDGTNLLASTLPCLYKFGNCNCCLNYIFNNKLLG